MREGRQIAWTQRWEKYIGIWKTTNLRTSKHFNEMAVKSRQLGLTFVARSIWFGPCCSASVEDEEYLFLF